MACSCGQHKNESGCAGARFLKALPRELRTRKPSGRPRQYPRTGPPCQCGCGRRCLKGSTWASRACMPRGAWSATMRTGWARVAERRRAQRFKADIDRLLVTGKISREDLIAFAHELYERGYHACMARERRRQGKAA